MAFLDAPTPIAFAHRGGADEAPENTLAAFAAAVDAGYRYLETDVHLSLDGEVFAFHDEVLDRVTNRSGRLAELTSARIREADAGWHFTSDGGATHPFRGRGVTVPTLEELLTRWPDVLVNIDTKSDAVVVPTVNLLQRLGALDRVCIGSFSDARLEQVRALSRGRICTSMGPRAVAIARVAASAHRAIPRRGADCIQVPIRRGGVPIVTPAFIRAAHRSGLPVHVWTIDDEPTMEHLLEIGVDGIMTDRPRLLRGVMERRGLWAPPAVAGPALA